MEAIDLIIEATESGKLKWIIPEYGTVITAKVGSLTLAMKLNPDGCEFEGVWAYDDGLKCEVKLESTKWQICTLVAAMGIKCLPSKANTLTKLMEGLEALRKE